MLCNRFLPGKKLKNSLDSLINLEQTKFLLIGCLGAPWSCFDTARPKQFIGNQFFYSKESAMNPQQLVIEEDTLSEKFSELQSNELVQ